MSTETLPPVRAIGCACATYADGSTHTFLCPLHADQDPCLSKSLITGKRRKGTIKSGTCTHCGWTHKRPHADLTSVIVGTLATGARADFEFYYEGTRWILSMAPVEG